MRNVNLKDMVRGWFVGNFSPTALATPNVEVAVKSYAAGDKEARHYHKIASEVTLVLSGRVLMNGNEFGSGEIIVLERMESCEFEVLVDAVTVVVKVPGASNDKYLGAP